MPEPQICPIDADYIRLRTSECGDCLEWTSTLNAGGYPVGTFRTRGPEGQPGQRQYYVRHLVWWLQRGAPPPVDTTHYITTTCGNPLCVASAHLVRKTRSRAVREAAARGAFKSLAFRAKVSQGRTRNSKLSPADVARIRTHTGALKPLANELGISESYAAMIRRGKNRRDYSTPFAGLMA